MQSPDTTEVMIGIHAYPIQQLKEENETEYNEANTTITNHSTNRIEGLPT